MQELVREVLKYKIAIISGMVTKCRLSLLVLGCLSMLLISGPLFFSLMIKASAVTVGTSSRYCATGTGPGTNKACIPCDIGLGTGHCVDTLTGWKPCPRYGPIPPDCTLNPFRQLPEGQLPTAGGVSDPGTAGIITEQPPFGFRNEPDEPLGGVTITQPPFGFRNDPNLSPLTGGGIVEQPQPFSEAQPPPPTPPPAPSQPVAPQDNQDDNDEEGSLPTLENNQNVPLGSTAGQPEFEQPTSDD
jgi:hypothetical protein